jgi:hypothetical protein
MTSIKEMNKQLTGKTPAKRWQQRLQFIRETFEFGPLDAHYNEEGQLHRDDGPAYISPSVLIGYRNGKQHGLKVDIWGSMSYFFDGVAVPNKFFDDPESLTYDEVLQCPNAEVRAVGVRVYGFERMLQEERLDVLDIDSETNEMLLKWNAPNADESFCLVRVFDATPNQDGTKDVYYLIVPPDMKKVREAVAWTFYKSESTYKPDHET